MFYNSKVRGKLLKIYSAIGVDSEYRGNELITNTIFDQGVRNLGREAKNMNLDPMGGALYCIRETLSSMRHEIADKTMPEEIISQIDKEVLRRLERALELAEIPSSE